MRYALVTPVLLAVTALAAPVPDQDGLIKTGDVTVNVRDANIPTAKRSEDLKIDDLSVDDVLNHDDVGILRRGDGNDEQEDDGVAGLGLDDVLDLVPGLSGILKRDDSLLIGDDVDGLLGEDIDLNLVKRKEETSIGGIGGVGIGSPVIDAVDVSTIHVK
jgi:hypothetical protein